MSDSKPSSADAPDPRGEARPPESQLQRAQQDAQAAEGVVLELKAQLAQQAQALGESALRNQSLQTANDALREANTTLGEANNHLRALFETAQLGTLLVDRDLRIQRFNSFSAAVFGLGDEDRGAPFARVAAQLDDPEVVEADLQRVLTSGAWSQREVQVIRGGWYLKRMLPWIGPEGRSDSVIVTFTDINALKTAQIRIKLAMAADRLVWWEWNLSDGTLSIHGETPCMLGYGLDTLPRSAEGWFTLTHPADLEAVRRAAERCVAGLEPMWALEHRVRDAQGNWRWVHTTGALGEHDAQDRPTRMLGITRDIHASRVARDQLRRDAQILAQLHDVVVYCDPEHRIVSVNDAYERTFGWSRQEATGNPVWFRRTRELAGPAKAWLDRVLQGESAVGEWEDCRRNGEPMWMNWRSTRLLDANGTVLGTVSVGTEITEQKRIEQERAKLQDQLFHSQRLETLGTLAGGIAHDFNNILGAIFGFTELAIAASGDNPQTRHLHEQVMKAGERARELVKRILSFSRFNEPHRQAVRLTDVVSEAAKFIRASLPATIELHTDLPGESPVTQADPNQFHQVLLNLATNAAHAMPDQRGHFRLRVGPCETKEARLVATGILPAGQYVTIDAIDDGAGMEESVRGRIFDPFFTTKKAGMGTGLGLSVVRAIVHGHGGQIDVASVPGRGTTFTLFIPVADEPKIMPEQRGPEDIEPLRGSGERVAVIDDEDAIRLVTEKTLQAYGYKPESFADAASFLAAFNTEPGRFAVVVTDQTMPGITGDQIINLLRRQGSQIPVLLMSGYSKRLESQSLSAVPGLRLLRKPFDSVELARAVKDLIESGRR